MVARKVQHGGGITTIPLVRGHPIPVFGCRNQFFVAPDDCANAVYWACTNVGFVLQNRRFPHKRRVLTHKRRVLSQNRRFRTSKPTFLHVQNARKKIETTGLVSWVRWPLHLSNSSYIWIRSIRSSSQHHVYRTLLLSLPLPRTHRQFEKNSRQLSLMTPMSDLTPWVRTLQICRGCDKFQNLL